MSDLPEKPKILEISRRFASPRLKRPTHDKETSIMALNDFLRDWTVLEPGSEECKANQRVKISGTEGKGGVRIECDGRFPYSNATYNKDLNGLEGDGFIIKLQISFIPASGSHSGGSWTAEDNPSGPAE